MHKAYLFKRGLQLEIYQFVQPQHLQTLDEVIEMALWVERGATIIKEQAELWERDKEKKRLAGSSRE